VIRTLLDGRLAAGDHPLCWDGRGNGGRSMTAGVYLLQLRAGEQRIVRKFLRLQR